MKKIQASRGTRDIVAPEIRVWQRVEAVARDLLARAAYTEIRTPLFEATELFARGIGDTTDIVGKEMYTFTDRGDRSLTLRPEGTAGAVRALIEHNLMAKGGTQRLWYLGPMFRYERPQAGRQRQFHQLGIEVFGSHDPRADAETIALACELLAALGLEHLVVELNSVGDAEDRDLYRAALVDYLTPYAEDLDPDSRDRLTRNPLRILDSKDPRTQEIVAGAPSILARLGPQSRSHFERVQALLAGLGIAFRLNPRLVRGLDYYTHTAFEIQSTDLGAQAAVCGGGRYDRLVAELGGADTPAVGWAMGLERLTLLLQQQGEIGSNPLDAYLVARGEEAEAQALYLAQSLRRQGYRIDLDLSGAKFDKQLKRADASGAAFALILGKDEAMAGLVQVKRLDSGVQETRAIAALLAEGLPHRA